MSTVHEHDKVTEDGTVRLLFGDCMERMKDLPESSIDVVVTSPPYNIGINYNSYSDNKTYDDYLDWMGSVFDEIFRVLGDNGSFFLNVGSTNVNPWLSFDVAARARESFILQNRFVWAKSIAVGDTTYGHFKPINSKRFVNNLYEDVFHFTKTGKVELQRKAIGVPFQDKSNIARFGHEGDLRCKGNIWHIPYETVQSKGQKLNHPAIYPVGFAEHCIKLHGVPADDGSQLIVLDPFVGTGTTLVAAQKLGVSGVGVEMDETYFDTAWGRVSEYQKNIQQALDI